MLNYRAPKVFVQFINERQTFVAPEHIIGARTAKSMGSAAGMFELSFKTSDLKEGRSTNPLRPSKTNKPTDYWMDMIRPMTVAVIAMGSEKDIRDVGELLTSMPPSVSPTSYYEQASAEKRKLIDRTVVMVGLVEEVAFNLMMTSEGPQRLLRVAGRDFGKVLMDDSIRRIARATENTPDERRIVTLGGEKDMPQGQPPSILADDRDRLLNRASLNAKTAFWKDISTQGLDSKEYLNVSVARILENAPSMNVKLDNDVELKSYFNSKPVVAPELEGMTVRATLSLFTYNGPVWDSITQLAPAPLAEVYVDTVGLKNVMHIRRPPFYRPSLMKSMLAKTRAFLELVRGRALRREIDKILEILDSELTEDKFAASYSTIEQDEIIGIALSRAGTTAFSQYQVVPSLLMRGEMGELAAFQGVSASYLYDLPTAIRFGSKLLQAICPWDVTRRIVASRTKTLRELDEEAALRSLRERDPEAAMKEVVKRQSQAISQEQTLSASETMRLYYYFRDSSAFLNGTLTTRARPEIRIGDRVYLPGYDDTIAYVEAVQHVYQYGQPFVSQLTVSRGQPLKPTRSRLVNYDVDNPAMNSE